jgi:DNA-binding transcriptional LysR family regulator
VASEGVTLRDVQQSIRLSVVDYWIPVVMGQVLRSIAEQAPGIDVVCMPWSGAGDTHSGLQAGTLDLAMSLVAPSALRFRPVRHESYVLAMRDGHPAKKRLADSWLEYPHVVVSGEGMASGAPDMVLAERGKKRTVAMVVPSFLAVPGLLMETDLLALIPETVARLSRNIAFTKPPIDVAGFDVALAWHSRRDADPATAFLRDEIARVARA